jgi:hypothetical protein
LSFRAIAAARSPQFQGDVRFESQAGMCRALGDVVPIVAI